MKVKNDVYKENLTLNCGLRLKNRILMAPMTTKLSFHNGDVTKDELAYYKIRSGEVGAVITAAANVQDDGKGWEGEVSAVSDDNLPSLKSLANTIKINDTKAIIQLFHAGRMTSSKVLRGQQPVSASAVAALRDNAETPRVLSESEIYEIIENFKKATMRSYEAGFDGIELHGANTYLIQQFFSPHSNRRTDKWGGSLENRYRFIDLLTDEIISLRKFFDRPFAIGYRFSPEEFEKPGISLDDTLYLVDKLADKDLDYLHISLDDYARKSILEKYQNNSILYHVHNKIAKRLPLIGVGGVKESADLINVLKNAELAAVGKSLILDPQWVSKVFNNREKLIRKQIAKEDLYQIEIPRSLESSLLLMMKETIK